MADTLESLRAQLAELEGRVKDLTGSLAAAEAQNKRLEGLLECVPGILWEARGMLGDPMQQNTYVSPQGEAMLGYSPEELRAPNFWVNIMHPEDREKLTRPISKITSRFTKMTGVEYRVLSKSGREIWLENYPFPLRDPSGLVVGMRGVALDVTKKKRTEAERSAIQGRLQHLLLASHVVLYSSTPGDLRVNFISDNVREQFGYDAREFLGNHQFWADRVHPEDAPSVVSGLQSLYDKGHYDCEYRFLHKDGTYRWVQDNSRLLRDQEGRDVEVVGAWQDVTARKIQEQTIREQAAALTELSTPIIPISDEVLALPLVGAVDTQRAEQVLETMLEGISKRRARVAILDITGVKGVDQEVAEAWVRVARAVQLLGTQLIITGIRPEVAQALVRLGADLGALVTLGTLQAGIAYATRKVSGKSGKKKKT